MTLQNGLTHGRKAYLWCDTAFWNDQTGELAYHAPKAFQSFGWPFAGTLSTWGGDGYAMVDHIRLADPQNLDSLLTVAADALRWFVIEGGGGRIMLASFEDRPRLHLIPSHVVFPGYTAFEPVELDYFVCSANDSDAVKVAMRRGFNPKRMRRAIDAQCVTPFAGHGVLAGLGDRVWIGGNVVRLEVSADGVTSAIERPV